MILMLSPYGLKRHIPRRVIVHAMGEFINDGHETYSAVKWLEHLKLSAHVLVPPHGEPIRTREDHQIAFHAGRPDTGPYAGQSLNTGALGVEVLVPGTHNLATLTEAIKTTWVNGEQFVHTVNVIADWCRLHRIEEVNGHHHYDPDRKPDPGAGFPMDALHSEIRRAGFPLVRGWSM